MSNSFSYVSLDFSSLLESLGLLSILVSKELLMRADDVQVLHGFESEADAKAYLTTDIFQNDVVSELKPFLEANPEIRIYSVFKN